MARSSMAATCLQWLPTGQVELLNERPAVPVGDQLGHRQVGLAGGAGDHGADEFRLDLEVADDVDVGAPLVQLALAEPFAQLLLGAGVERNWRHARIKDEKEAEQCRQQHRDDGQPDVLLALHGDQAFDLRPQVWRWVARQRLMYEARGNCGSMRAR